MEEEIQSVTSAEWKLVHRRLDDLETLVTDLKLKLEKLGDCKCNPSNSHLETHYSDDEEETETGIGLNTQSNLTSAASKILGIPDQSTTHSEEILTSAEQDGNNTADLKSTPSTGSNLSDITSAHTAHNGTSVSTKSTMRLSNEIGIREIEKYRRAEVKLTRCDKVEVAGTSSTSEFRNANDKSTLTSTNKESHILSNKRSVLQTENGVRAQRTTAPSLVKRGKRFVCHICSKRFGSKSHLTVHMRVHTGDKPFHCNICSMKFNQTSHLKAHIKVHTGDKPFECGFCSKKFSQSSSLTLHRRVHTGDKPFQCGLCLMKFGQKQSLASHVRRHTGERPYTCQFCSKGFATHSELTMHLRVHTREKPYSCPFCPNVFSQQAHLNRHLKRHLGGTPQPQVQIHQ